MSGLRKLQTFGVRAWDGDFLGFIPGSGGNFEPRYNSRKNSLADTRSVPRLRTKMDVPRNVVAKAAGVP